MSGIKSAVCLLMTFAIAVCSSNARGAVIISEIMYNPQGTDSDAAAVPPYNREWIDTHPT